MSAVWEGKKYKLDSSENFNEYMKAIGVNLITRQLGNTVSPSIALSKNGDTYTFATTSTLKNKSFSFKEGVEFEDETLDGRTVKNIITFDGNTMIQEEKSEKPHKIIRVFTENDVTATIDLEGIHCVRIYKLEN